MSFFTKYIKWCSVFILSTIFILQGIWVYKTFQLSRSNLTKEVRQAFIYSTQQETDFREKKRQVEINSNKQFVFKYDNLEISSYPVNIMILEALYFYGCPIKVANISKILKEELKKRNIYTEFVINRTNPKDNIILESTASETKKEWSSALKVESIPLRVDKSEVLQLYLLKPNWTIFHQIIIIIISLSILLILLVAMGLWWQYSSYLRERKLRQFQKDHTEAVIHNMATPLQTIKITTETLKGSQRLPRDKQEKFLAILERQTGNLQDQVKKILTVSRANKSGLAINTKTVNIENLINNASEQFRNIRKKEVHLDTIFTLEHPSATIDAQLFTEVLSNLIENSIKYSGESVKITINCECTSKELIVKVTDNGLGIAPKYQKHIFDKFNRGAAPFRGGVRGFGIGLSFAKVVIEAHEGKITLFSKGENKGTTFTIRIPQ